MILTRKEIETLLGESEVMLKGSLKNTKIMAYLLNFKYDAPRIAIGEGLLGEAMVFYENRIVKGGQQLVATSELEAAIGEVKPVYNVHLTVGRLILKHKPNKWEMHSMEGPRKADFVGWRIQGIAFYNSLLKDDEMVAKFDEFGVTRENLESGKALLENVMVVNIDQEGAKSEAQSSTWKRDNVVFNLADWIHDFRVILKLALAPEPQLLEAVGIKA
ncbi:MAG: hypothetical protein GY950_28480 [bacterium]|nr:hypothetical protein [bacterium]